MSDRDLKLPSEHARARSETLSAAGAKAQSAPAEEFPEAAKHQHDVDEHQHEAERSGVVAFSAGALLLVGAAIFSWSVLGSAKDTSAIQGGAHGSAHGGGGHGGHGRGQKAKGPSAVRVHDVELGTLTQQRRVPGELFVQRRAILRARATGEVMRVPVRLGSSVRPGTLIAALDAGTLYAEIARGEALLDAAVAKRNRAAIILTLAQTDHERTLGLQKDGAASSAEVEKSNAAVAIGQADLALAIAEQARAAADLEIQRVRLRQTRITAPFAGRVAELSVEEGTVVNATTAIAILVADEAPRVRFSIGESDATALSIGTPIVVRIGDAAVQGEIEALGAEVDQKSRTFPVEAVLKPDESTPLLLPGTFVEIEVGLGATSNATLVPLEALLGRGPVRKVIVIEEGTARFVDAQVLMEDGQRAAVSGITVGQQVVVGGQEGLADGARVEVVP